MGMFDDVGGKIVCPQCGCEIIGFQTKDMSKTLSLYNISELNDGSEYHTICENCKTWCSFVKNTDIQADLRKREFTRKQVIDYLKYCLSEDELSSNDKIDLIIKKLKNGLE